MRKTVNFIVLSLLLSGCNTRLENRGNNHSEGNSHGYEYAIVIHGGAGYATPEKLGDAGEQAYSGAMDSALQIGLTILESGGASIDAVEQVIRYLEDNPLFNAGKGAALTSEGLAELDASVMQGSDLNAGAVTGLTDVKHPITAARAGDGQFGACDVFRSGCDKICNIAGTGNRTPGVFHNGEEQAIARTCLERG